MLTQNNRDKIPQVNSVGYPNKGLIEKLIIQTDKFIMGNKRLLQKHNPSLKHI